MPAHAPQSCCVESFVVWHGQLFQLFPAIYHFPLLALELPLLFVGHGLVYYEAQHQYGPNGIHPAERRGGIHAYQRWQGYQEQQHILIDGDE